MAGVRKTMLHVVILTAVAFAVALWSTSAAAQGTAAATYKAKCQMCHGADGKGDTPAGKKMGTHDFASADVQKMSDADLTEAIEKGKNKMPSYSGKLKDTEIKELVGYVRGLGKGK